VVIAAFVPVSFLQFTHELHTRQTKGDTAIPINFSFDVTQIFASVVWFAAVWHSYIYVLCAFTGMDMYAVVFHACKLVGR